MAWPETRSVCIEGTAMTAKTLVAEVTVPYTRAVCHDPHHPKQRCAIGRTAFGPGKFAYLHKLRGVPADQVDCPPLALPLYKLGREVLAIAERGGLTLDGQLYVDGPYPDYLDDHSSPFLASPHLEPEAQQEAVLAAAGIVTDQVRFRLYGRFIGKEQAPCRDSGEPTISDQSEEFLVSTP